MIGLKKKSKNGWKCRQRATCLRPLVDDALMVFLKKEKRIFSEWNAKLIKDKLIELGYYTK